MNFRKIAVLALFATTLATTFALTAHADESSARVQLGIQSVCGQYSHLYDISNIGNVASSSNVIYTVKAGASEAMPPLFTWRLRLMPLQPGQTFQLAVPRAAWGLMVSVKIEAAPGLEVTQSGPTAVQFPTFCW
jgi:hypothetical protein